MRLLSTKGVYLSQVNFTLWESCAPRVPFSSKEYCLPSKERLGLTIYAVQNLVRASLSELIQPKKLAGYEAQLY